MAIAYLVKRKNNMAQETLNGKDYIVFVDTTTATTADAGAAYEAVMCMVTNGFSMTRDSVEVSNKCNDGWGNSNPGTGSWEITGDGHAIDEAGTPSQTSYQTLAELAKSGDKFWAKIADVDTTGTSIIHREGVVWISSYDETAGTDEPYSFSFTFQGVGEPLLEASV